jgi:chromate reductase, NAD(P)H dehydrogenase (quinone)
MGSWTNDAEFGNINMLEDVRTLRLGTIPGSLRKNSFCRVLSQSLQSLVSDDTQIEELPSIGSLPLFNQDILDEEGVPDEVTRLSEALASVDGIIIVSPEYNWSIPGALKNALDWISRVPAPPLQNKPVTIFTCSPGLLGGARAHSPIRNVLHALDCKILARPEVQIAQIAAKVSFDPPKITDVATTEFVTARLVAFGDFIKATKR